MKAITRKDDVAEQISPHGGVLVNRILSGAVREEALERSMGLRRMRLSHREASDLELIGTGALSPLTGFAKQQDYRSVVREMRLDNGLVWSLPVTLAIGREQARAIPEGAEIRLDGPGGNPLAIMDVEEKYECDREQEALQCFGTTDRAHPGVRCLLEQGEVNLGGAVRVIGRIASPFPDFDLGPAQTRAIFRERGWRRVVGFQTRNPVHRAHEYIQKCALEICDGLLLHPLVGETKADDLSAHVRMQAYQAILDRYYPAERTLLAVFPAAMRYAGPREAIWHAICRKNYGCTHFIVGRDHAGVGNYYGTYDAQRIFERFSPAEVGIVPLCFENTFFCRACGNMASPKTCPHGESEHASLSGTRVREMLAAGQSPPNEFTRPEVAQVLIRGLSGR